MEAVAKAYPRALVLPIIYTPNPPIGASPETLYKKLLEGNDPETGKQVIQEIIDALTQPQKEKRREPAPAPAAIPREQQLTGAEDDLQQLFYDSGWTDGLPIILPTTERVERMLKGTSHAPDEEVGKIYDHDHHELITYTVRDTGHSLDETIIHRPIHHGIRQSATSQRPHPQPA
jgi:hypothetical protein